MEYDDAGRSKGSAFAWYENKQDMSLAIQTYSDRELDGLKLSVEDCGDGGRRRSDERRGSDDRDDRRDDRRDVMSRLGPPVRNGDGGGRRENGDGEGRRENRGSRGGRSGRGGKRGGSSPRRVVTHADLDMELDGIAVAATRTLVTYDE
jgi:hypothetical protein